MHWFRGSAKYVSLDYTYCRIGLLGACAQWDNSIICTTYDEWQWWMIQAILQEAMPCLMFLRISSVLMIGYLQKWSSLVICKVTLVRTTFVCLLHLVPLVEYFISPTPNFLEQCTSYGGSRQISSRQQHAPNKQSPLNNDVQLITRFYGRKPLLRVGLSINSQLCD